MPISADTFEHTVKSMIKLCRPTIAVDIGPGIGKYGSMLNEIECETDSKIHKICVEIDKEKIIERFSLHRIYNEILHENAAALPKAYPALTGDIVVAGDVIEHLTKSQGIDLIEYLQYRFKHIFLIIPINWVTYSYEDYENESHISIWRKRDIENFEGGYCVERIFDEHRFLLASVNGIMLGPTDHFIVRDTIPAIERRLGDIDIEFGYLNR
jgi:hypothetical protein